MGSIQPGLIKGIWILLLAGALIIQPLFSFGKKDTDDSVIEENQRPGEAPMERHPDPLPPPTGAYAEMDLDSTIVQDAVSELIFFLEDSSESVVNVEILKAEAQVVAGHKVRLYYLRNGRNEETAIVFFPLDTEEAPQVYLQDE